MNKFASLYKRHRFPPDVIQHAVWLYLPFNLSARDIKDLLAERGIVVSYQSIRLWGTDKLTYFSPHFGQNMPPLQLTINDLEASD